MKVLISGASGLIGTALSAFLEKDSHEAWKLVRREANLNKNEIFWDPESRFLNLKSLEGFDAIINLSGENIAGGRWSRAFKKSLRDSRVNTTLFLADSINKLKNPPKVFLSGSAIGFYGDRGNEELHEESQEGKGFLPALSIEWENAALTVKNSRVILLRTGLVLSKQGGAIKKMLLPFKLGLGGKLGDGSQFMSWISLEDECRAIYFCMLNENISGPVNLTAPEPVTNEIFTKEFAKALGRPAFFPVPRFILKILLGEMADQALLASAKVKPAKLLSSDFSFRHINLTDAFKSIL